jgi:hypothetical protein
MTRKPATKGDLHIPRRAAQVQDGGARETRWLAQWRDLESYVLLGDPGAGKTEALRAEAWDSGGVYVSAKDFITLGIDVADAGKPIFIDGLDEMGAGTIEGLRPLDHIRRKLKEHGQPRFRLSCREYDWRSHTDLEDMRQVARGGDVQELHLEALSREEQLQFLRAKFSGDAEDFLKHADQHGIAELLGNPLLLDLTLRAVTKQGDWPGSRRAIYDLACRELATEKSEAHRRAKPLQPGDIDHLLDDAGMLCAVLLISGKASLSSAVEPADSSIAWHTLPEALKWHKPEAALASKIFTTTAGESAPRHRSIAEYLAGQSMAKRVQDQALPLGRVLALLQGGGGGAVAEPLRGLLAWLAVHDPRDRQQLIERAAFAGRRYCLGHRAPQTRPQHHQPSAAHLLAGSRPGLQRGCRTALGRVGRQERAPGQRAG